MIIYCRPTGLFKISNLDPVELLAVLLKIAEIDQNDEKYSIWKDL